MNRERSTGVAGGIWRRVAVTALVFATALNSGQAQKKEETPKSLFGVRLNREALALLKEIDEVFSVPVREAWVDDPKVMSGKSWISDDGTPTIQINRANGKTLDVIVHELYHLKLKGEGYPAVDWRYPIAMDTEENRAAFAQLAEQVHDPIEHYMFYDAIRRWDINPGGAFERQTDNKLRDGSLQATFATMDRGAVALYYFKIRLEVSNGFPGQTDSGIFEHCRAAAGN